MWKIKLKTILDESNPNNGKYFKQFTESGVVYSSKEEAFVIDANSFDVLSRLNSEFGNNGKNIHTIEKA